MILASSHAITGVHVLGHVDNDLIYANKAAASETENKVVGMR